jgi:hypothetical protein
LYREITFVKKQEEKENLNEGEQGWRASLKTEASCKGLQNPCRESVVLK